MVLPITLPSLTNKLPVSQFAVDLNTGLCKILVEGQLKFEVCPVNRYVINGFEFIGLGSYESIKAEAEEFFSSSFCREADQSTSNRDYYDAYLSVSKLLARKAEPSVFRDLLRVSEYHMFEDWAFNLRTVLYRFSNRITSISIAHHRELKPLFSKGGHAYVVASN